MFASNRRDVLTRYLAMLPTQFRYAVEVRQRGWLNDAFFALLKEHRVAFALSDYRRMPAESRVTADFVYIRLLVNHKAIPDDQFDHVRFDRTADLERWGDVISNLNDKGVAAWVFVNKHYQGHSLATVRLLTERITQ
jgi:uncharacterized protein YecE (DUF72 family)